MNAKRFVVHISGPPCSGKTTLENALAERLPGAYTLSFDRMKWQLAGYDRSKDGPLVDDLALGFFEVVCRKGIPLLFDFSFKTEEEYRGCRDIAERNGYKFISVELTAPIPVLLERFHKRIAEAERTGARITITDEDTFLATAAKVFFMPPDALKFDTSVSNMGEIADQVAGLV